MTAWFGPALLTACVLALLLLPLRRRAPPTPREAYDRAVYRDQLTELDRDIARGLLADSEVAGVRLELQRRLLAVAEDPTVPSRPRNNRALAAVLAVMVTGSALALYLTIGTPGLPDVPFASRRDLAPQDPARTAELRKLADELQARLQKDGGNQEGWLLLARTAAGLDQWPRAAEAYHHALQQGAQGAETLSAYGESLVMGAAGMVTPTALEAFQAALTQDHNFPIARYYLALADAQAGRAQAAIAAWTALIAELPPGASARAILAQRISETAAAAGLPQPALPTR